MNILKRIWSWLKPKKEYTPLTYKEALPNPDIPQPPMRSIYPLKPSIKIGDLEHHAKKKFMKPSRSSVWQKRHYKENAKLEEE